MATKPPTKGEILDLANNDALLKSHYGGLTLASIRQNLYVLFVAAFAVTGALCFGIDQGVYLFSKFLSNTFFHLPLQPTPDAHIIL